MNTKQCTCCLKTLPYEQFSKNSRAKDGKQFHCKACNKKSNHKFRTQINPEHHADWQRNHKDKLIEIVSKYRKADKGGWIYYIAAPDGKFYVGMTQMWPKVRLLEHKMKWKMYQKGHKALCPKLYESFNKWGYDAHRLGILLELGDTDRKTLRYYESICIEQFMKKGKSLNKQK